MARTILILFLFMISTPCFSTSVLPPATPNNELPTQEHNKWEFGLGFNLGFTSTSGIIIGVNPSIQYFIMKDLSLGGFIHYYYEKNLSFISAGPSATYFVYRDGPYSIILNQRVRFREYLDPDGLNAAQIVSLTTLAADWSIGRGLSMRAGIGYKKSLDGKALAHNGDLQDEWVFPALGFAYYL